MRPPEKRTGPAANGTGIESLSSKDNPTVSADSSELWRALAGCPPESLHYAAIAWHVGTSDAWREGFDVGFAAAEHDMQIHWYALACKVRRDASRPSFAELQARRGEVSA